jgi:hypothetical protein
MGISVTIVAAADAEIHRFSSDSAALHRRFHAAGAGPSCHLNDFWDGLDFVLTAESGDALPLAAIKRGDVRYPDADDPTHAIFAATAKRLADELAALSEPELRRRYDPPAMLGDAGGRMVYPGRLWTPGAADRVFGELMGYFRNLRRCVAAAAAARLGLVVYRYEDF